MKRRFSNSGFTLLELILAMGMICMLAVSLYGTLRVAFKARDSAVSGITTMRAANVAMDMLGQDLESALPPTGLLAGIFVAQHNGDVQTSLDVLEFYCVGSSDSVDPPRSAGIRKVDLGVLASPDGRGYLLVRHVTHNLLAPQEVQPDEEILCRNVKSFSMRYFDGEQWQEDWDSSQMGNILPVAVQVDLILQTSQDLTAPTYHTSRVFSFACHTDETTASTGTTVGATGSTGTGGATGAGGSGARTGGGGR